MNIAIPLYPRFTALDAVGPYTVLAFAPGCTVTFVAAEPGPVLDDRGSLSLAATASYGDLPAPDVVVVPGGPGTIEALSDTELLSWIARAHEGTRWTTSVCSGSFLLGAAGLLKGRRATTHWGWLDQLAGFGAEPVGERVVIDGKIVTAAGVSMRHRHGPEPAGRDARRGDGADRATRDRVRPAAALLGRQPEDRPE